jgi:hypothetical protein
LCESNTCLAKNIYNYASKYDAGVVGREFSKNYLPYIAGGVVTSVALLAGAKYCWNRRRRRV